MRLQGKGRWGESFEVVASRTHTAVGSFDELTEMGIAVTVRTRLEPGNSIGGSLSMATSALDTPVGPLQGKTCPTVVECIELDSLPSPFGMASMALLAKPTCVRVLVAV